MTGVTQRDFAGAETFNRLARERLLDTVAADHRLRGPHDAEFREQGVVYGCTRLGHAVIASSLSPAAGEFALCVRPLAGEMLIPGVDAISNLEKCRTRLPTTSPLLALYLAAPVSSGGTSAATTVPLLARGGSHVCNCAGVDFTKSRGRVCMVRPRVFIVSHALVYTVMV